MAAFAEGASGCSAARRPALTLRVLWGIAAGRAGRECADFSGWNGQVMIPLLLLRRTRGGAFGPSGIILGKESGSSSGKFGFYLGRL